MTVLLVASTGGHLAQLHQLRPRLVRPDDPVVWVTFDTPQSRSLLKDEPVEFLPYIAPRDAGTILRSFPRALQLIREHDVDRVFTTGAGVALSILPVARALRIPCHYIESAARSTGPSLTGQVAARIPGVKTYTQYDRWASRRWQRSVSVFDDFVPADSAATATTVRRVVVTLGTIQGYGFRSLVERLLEIVPDGTEVLWQTGDTDVSGLPIEARPAIPYAELAAAITRADVVVAHAGIGSALSALEQGRFPVLVPRRAERHEHVDDHQTQIAGELADRGLSLHREVGELAVDDLVTAARHRVTRVVRSAGQQGAVPVPAPFTSPR